MLAAGAVHASEGNYKIQRVMTENGKVLQIIDLRGEGEAAGITAGSAASDNSGAIILLVRGRDQAIIDCATGAMVGMDEDFKAVCDDVNNDPVGVGTTSEQGFDPDRYRHHLDGFALAREQEDESMRVLWTMMLSFVDLGWGVDSVHNIFSQMVDKSLNDEENSIESKNTHTGEPIKHAAKTARKDEA